MEALFIGAAEVVLGLGLPAALLFVGLAPIYAGAYIFWRKRQVAPRKNPVWLLIVSAAVSGLLCGVFWISAAVLGQWG